MLRETDGQLDLWEALLPHAARRLPGELARIDAFLDDERFITPWRCLFAARVARPSVRVDTLLRLLYLKHRSQLGYETLCREVDDSITWRRFCRLGLDRPVPHPTTLVKLVGRAGPGVVEQLNAALLGKLAEVKVLRGRNLRVDTTMVEADIDHPTDADLLDRAVGKLGGLVARIKQHGAATRTAFRDRPRAAGRRLRGVRTIPDRLISLADPDARPIRKGKPQHPIQFGYTALISEDERGFVADHQVFQGSPPDAGLLAPSLQRAMKGHRPPARHGDCRPRIWHRCQRPRGRRSSQRVWD